MNTIHRLAVARIVPRVIKPKMASVKTVPMGISSLMKSARRTVLRLVSCKIVVRVRQAKHVRLVQPVQKATRSKTVLAV